MWLWSSQVHCDDHSMVVYISCISQTVSHCWRCWKLVAIPELCSTKKNEQELYIIIDKQWFHLWNFLSCEVQGASKKKKPQWIFKNFPPDNFYIHVCILWYVLWWQSTFHIFVSKLENRICRQIPVLHSSFSIKERRKHRGCYPSCTYTVFLPQRVEIELIFALRPAVSEIQGDFRNWHIEAWNLATGKSSRSCTYQYALFLPQGVKIKLIFTLRAAFSEIQADFQKCHILHESFDHKWQKFEKLHILLFSTPKCQSWAYIRSSSSGFWHRGWYSKLSYLGMKLVHCLKVQKLHIYSFYSRGLKLSFFPLYGERFLRYGVIFKIAIFRHETWPMTKFPEVTHTV